MLAYGLIIAVLAAGCCAAAAAGQPSFVDLSRAAIYAPAPSTRNRRALEMLADEVAKRSQIRWSITSERPTESVPVISVGTAAALRRAHMEGIPDSRALKREGYLLWVSATGSTPSVLVAGADDRGVLYGIGRLLRNLRLERQRIEAPAGLELESAPRYPLRGHQLGYRPKTNSYDGWSVPMWEQYIRDLAVFGANAVELIPPRSDDAADSPLFPLPPMQMMAEMSRLLDEYGLDVWIWYPAMDPDYSRPEMVEKAVAEWAQVFKKLPRLDAVFVPGGDPGHTEPKHLVSLLEEQAASLRKYHPKAQIWVSPQGFSHAWLDEFIRILKDKQPAWLTGVVYGPQVRVPIAGFREMVPKRYPIRDYPDITHSIQCQCPVPDWDVAFALTEGRECINPRPVDEATIIRATQGYTAGFISYSEGCNDDVNKAVWSALAWDPGADVTQVLREYSRYFVGDAYADPFAQGLLSLERDWRQPVASSSSIDTTFEQFRAMERAASPRVRLNWRFQQALYRAY